MTVSATLTATVSKTSTPSTTVTPLPPTPSVTVTETPVVSPTPTYTVSNTPLPTATPNVPAVLDRNLFRPGLGQDLHIGIKSAVGGRVRVTVFNVAAEKVRQPFDADVPADVTVDVPWDGKNELGEPCGAGVYVVSVQGAGISKILKVVLLK